MTTHPTPEALAACPFCGCSIHLESNNDWHRLQGDHDDWCPFASHDETLMSPATDDQLALLYRDWNRRAPSAELAAARAEVNEQARLNGMGAERELALIAERDSLREEVDRLRKPLDAQAARAIAVSLELGHVSVSGVQRKLKIGWSESQALCQRIVDAGWVDGLPMAPSLKAPPVADEVKGTIE